VNEVVTLVRGAEKLLNASSEARANEIKGLEALEQ